MASRAVPIFCITCSYASCGDCSCVREVSVVVRGIESSGNALCLVTYGALICRASDYRTGRYRTAGLEYPVVRLCLNVTAVAAADASVIVRVAVAGPVAPLVVESGDDPGVSRDLCRA